MNEEGLRIPYYFPPQRYIPRLGGMGGGGGGSLSPAGAGFQGLAQAMEMYSQLQQAKDLKQEREKDKATRESDLAKDRAEREEDRKQRAQYHQEDVERGYEDRGERRDEAAASRLERGGAFLMPGAQAAARTAGVARQPIAPGVMDVTSPEGATAYAGGALEGTKRGEQGLNADVLTGVQKAAQTEGVEPIGPGGQYGFARPIPSEVAAKDRLSLSNKTGVDTRHAKWMDAKVRYSHNHVAELERDNPGMTPEEIRAASEEAQNRFDQLFPEPGAEGPVKKGPVNPFVDFLKNNPDLLRGMVKP